MRDVPPDPPAGFTEFSLGTTNVVCATHIAGAIREALAYGTLLHYAEQHPDARPLRGRGIAYAVPLPGGVEQAVVRHNRHGGLFASITRDVFRAPTRAPYELRVSKELATRGVPVAVFLGYATYAAGPGVRRADVVTREVSNAFDLSVALRSDDTRERAEALNAAAQIVAALSRARARHHDLNVKNILLHRRETGQLDAIVLDLDRVTLGQTSDAARAHNLVRLLRSARKWQTRYGALVSDAELDVFVRAVRDADPARRTMSS